MRFQNIGKSKHVLFHELHKDGNLKGMIKSSVVCHPGEIVEIKPTWPDHLRKLEEHYPKEFRKVVPAAPAMAQEVPAESEAPAGAAEESVAADETPAAEEKGSAKKGSAKKAGA